MVWNWLSSLLQPHLDWIQVEITSYCDCRCIYCPQTANRDQWPRLHMPMESYRQLVPTFKNTRMVHLQGWGEPLLHPDYFAMAALAKKAGCEVGTTTNGMLLDEDKIERILETDIDLVAFSLAATSIINDEIRKGTDISVVLESIRKLDRVKKQRGVERPAINVAYMLLRSQISELEALPEILRDTGVNQVVISTLDFVPAKSLDQEAISSTDLTAVQRICSVLTEIADPCAEQGISLHFSLASPTDSLTCAERPHRALFVAVDGSVSPCVYTSLRLAFNGATNGISAARRFGFGNINQEHLSNIWWKRPYRRFRDSLFTVEPPGSCTDCHKLGRS